MPNKIRRLPKEFKEYFWDVGFKKLSLKKHFNFILSRLMNLGDQLKRRFSQRTIVT